MCSLLGTDWYARSHRHTEMSFSPPLAATATRDRIDAFCVDAGSEPRRCKTMMFLCISLTLMVEFCDLPFLTGFAFLEFGKS